MLGKRRVLENGLRPTYKLIKVNSTPSTFDKIIPIIPYNENWAPVPLGALLINLFEPR